MILFLYAWCRELQAASAALFCWFENNQSGCMFAVSAGCETLLTRSSSRRSEPGFSLAFGAPSGHSVMTFVCAYAPAAMKKRRTRSSFRLKV